MNRTEHRLRLSFDPDYAERHAEYVVERNVILKRIPKFLVQSLLPVLAGPMFVLIINIVFRPELAGKLIAMFLWIVSAMLATLAIVVLNDIRRARKSLGL